MRLKFKLGDKVRTLKEVDIYDIPVFPVNTVGTIIRVDDDEDDEQCYLVEEPLSHLVFWYSAKDLVLATNRDHLFTLQDQELASLLINDKTIEECDYAFDGVDEYCITNPVTYYVTPNGTYYDDNSYNEAIEETINWLNSIYND